MPKSHTLESLLVDELRDLLDAEKQITRALPKLAKTVQREELRAAFQEHLAQTEQQIERLNQAFDHLGAPARGKRCEGMAGLIEEGQHLMQEIDDPDVLDAALIGAAQKVEHYEIASYGTARAFAQQLGQDEIVALLGQTLDEEKETDQRLTQLAESQVNTDAAQGRGSEMEEDQELALAGSGSRTRTAAADRSRGARGGQSQSRGSSRSGSSRGSSRSSGRSGAGRSSGSRSSGRGRSR